MWACYLRRKSDRDLLQVWAFYLRRKSDRDLLQVWAGYLRRKSVTEICYKSGLVTYVESL